MAGFDLDKYKDLEDSDGTLPCVRERTGRTVSSGREDDRPDLKRHMVVMGKPAPALPDKPKAKANVARQMVVMSPVRPEPKKPRSMSDIPL